MHEIEFRCERYPLAKFKEKTFGDSVQALGTLQRPDHYKRSVAGSSRSAKLMRINDPNNKRSYRSSTKRPIDERRRCNFGFRIFLSSSNNLWYLRPHSPSFCCQHNHVKKDHNHIKISFDLISSEATQLIQNGANALAPTSVIRRLISQSLSLNLSNDQIRSVKKQMMEEAIASSSHTPYGSAVDKLISLFDSMQLEMNFVYVTHAANSGFVKYKKCRGKSLESALISSNQVGVTDGAMQTWRQALSVGGSEKILVSFAWSSNYELHEFSLFPEFVCTDTTFGLNKEERNLALFCGVDGEMKVTTFMRCLMPSQERRAYMWLFTEAIPTLLGVANISKTRCISMDSEFSFYSAFLAAKQARNDLYGNTILRLDTYHLVSKRIYELINRSLPLQEQEIIKVFHEWVVNLLSYVETPTEYTISRSNLDRYLKSVESVVRECTMITMNDILSSVDSKEEYTSGYHFTTTTDFGFVGDSIVEAANSVLKRHITEKHAIGDCALSLVCVERDKRETTQTYVIISLL